MDWDSMSKKRLWVVVIIMILVFTGGATTWFFIRKPEITAEIRGEKIALKMGCFACHGAGGMGGIADPISPSGNAPGFESGIVNMYIKKKHEIREWILYGTPKEKDLQENNQPKTEYLIPMPAYENYLSDREVDDLVTYVLAVSGWSLNIPDDAYEGRKVAQKLGCFGCHGQSGMGGMLNPGSFKGYIPPWNGDDFKELVQDENELREWILYGKPKRLWENPASRFFLNRQTIPMPAYQQYLSNYELNNLVAYIKWLRDKEGGKGEEISPIG